MDTMMNHKKHVVALLLTTSLVFAGIGVAVAHQGDDGQAMGRCGHGPGGAEAQLDEKTLELRKKFHEETSELRKKIFVTHAEINALMNSQAPDSKEVARLSAQLFDLKEQIQAKAEAAGLPMGGGCGMMAQGQGKPCGNQGPHCKQ